MSKKYTQSEARQMASRIELMQEYAKEVDNFLKDLLVVYPSLQSEFHGHKVSTPHGTYTIPPTTLQKFKKSDVSAIAEHLRMKQAKTVEKNKFYDAVHNLNWKL